MASDAISAGRTTHALVIGVEKLSRIVDWTDRNTCVLFGDGAGAVVLRASDGNGGVLATDLGSDGSGAEALIVREKEGAPAGETGPFVYMDGRRVFRFAARAMQTSVTAVARRAQVDIQDIDLIVPHQANSRIIEQACQRLKYPPEQVVVNLDRYGNTSAASVPIALCEAADEGRIKEGDLVALVAFGGGLTWGSALLRWGHLEPPLWHESLRARIGQFFGNALHRWHRVRDGLRRFADGTTKAARRMRRRARALVYRTLRQARNGADISPDVPSESSPTIEEDSIETTPTE
jgi:3-oxoacyl-[acyl-carrier-protein] synthase-3